MTNACMQGLNSADISHFALGNQQPYMDSDRCGKSILSKSDGSSTCGSEYPLYGKKPLVDNTDYGFLVDTLYRPVEGLTLALTAIREEEDERGVQEMTVACRVTVAEGKTTAACSSTEVAEELAVQYPLRSSGASARSSGSFDWPILMGLIAVPHLSRGM